MSRHRWQDTAATVPGRSRRARRWIPPAAVCALLALSAMAWLVLPAQGSPSADNAVPSGPSGQSAPTNWEPTTPDPDVAEPGADPIGSDEPSAVSVTIPSIGVNSTLVTLGVDPTSGVLIPPERYDIAGVFTEGPVPGEVGPAIIAGHVDSRAGPGVFYRLEEMVPDEIISVALSNGESIDFRVVEVAQYPKTAFPTTEVYGPTPDRELRLITCGGSFDPARRSYLDNIVVYAVRV